jgi:hypothetical protein
LLPQTCTDAKPFRDGVEQSRSLRRKLNRHEQFLFAQAQQSVACNICHMLETHLAL